jgi:hypothetical protein
MSLLKEIKRDDQYSGQSAECMALGLELILDSDRDVSLCRHMQYSMVLVPA